MDALEGTRGGFGMEIWTYSYIYGPAYMGLGVLQPALVVRSLSCISVTRLADLTVAWARKMKLE